MCSRCVVPGALLALSGCFGICQKYQRDQKYLKWAVHPHDLAALFAGDGSGGDDERNAVLKREEMQLFIPRISSSFSTELKDHHIVSCGLNTMWLPLFYGKICLQSVDCKAFVEVDADKIHVETMAVGRFDGEQRVWAAMRWKYGLRDAALSMNWVHFKRTVRSLWSRNQETESGHSSPKTLVFDRPFDFYLYDSRRQIVLASGTISGP